MWGAMAVRWRGLALLLLLVVCSASALPSDVDALQGLNQNSQDFTSGSFRHRSLLQAVPPTPAPVAVPPPRTPPTAAPAPVPPTAAPAPVPPTAAPAPVPPTAAPVPRTSPAKAPTPAPPTPVRTYLMYIGIGAGCLVFASVAVFCLCRKFGQNKIRGAQRLPPLPRYH